MTLSAKYFLIALGSTLVAGGVFYSILVFTSPKEISENNSIRTPEQLQINGSEQQSTEEQVTENQPTNEEQKNTQSQSSIEGSQTNNQITISKLGIVAPISLNIDGNNKEQYMKALEKGVAHMARTSMPGEVGNTVIFGHSSYFQSLPGNYKTIFAKLDQIKNSDPISLKIGDKIFTYSKIEDKIVEPTDLSVVEQKTNEKILTLITCWPPKTTKQRYIVKAKLIEN